MMHENASPEPSAPLSIDELKSKLDELKEWETATLRAIKAGNQSILELQGILERLETQGKLLNTLVSQTEDVIALEKSREDGGRVLWKNIRSGREKVAHR